MQIDVIDAQGGVSNVDIDGNNTLEIKAVGVTISSFETLPFFFRQFPRLLVTSVVSAILIAHDGCESEG